jgi:hypothetical protein
VNYEGNYVGHDEPSPVLLGYRRLGEREHVSPSLPHEAPIMPTQDGTGGTWNFQLHPAFWFGMALCESESFPNPGVPCTPDSDANISDNPDPTAPDWVGNHVGSGFLELQFYPPGWASAVSCDPTQWCVAMVTFGLSDSITETNNLDCLQNAGEVRQLRLPDTEWHAARAAITAPRQRRHVHCEPGDRPLHGAGDE